MKLIWESWDNLTLNKILPVYKSHSIEKKKKKKPTSTCKQAFQLFHPIISIFFISSAASAAPPYLYHCLI